MIVKSSSILTEEGMIDGTMSVENGIIKDIVRTEAEDVKADFDAGDALIIPGIIDTHNHGMMGYGPHAGEHAVEDIQGWMKALSASAVTAAFPTCMDSDTFEAVNKAKELDADGAQIMGIHSEGPYLNRVGEKGVDKGHPEITMEHVKEMIDAGEGNLKLVAIAPELQGADEAIRYFVKHGARCSIAHTNADYSEALHAFHAGVTVSTHTANVMTGIHHRNMGTLGAALLDDEVYNEVICDGLHVRNEMLEIMFRIKKDAFHKFMMISDNIPMAGMTAGRYVFEGIGTLNITEEGFCLTDTGRLCGSAKPVLYGMKNLTENLNMDIRDISRMASFNVAECYGFADQKGSLRRGKDADFAVLDHSFNCLYTYRQGRCVFDHKKDVNLINQESFNKWKV